MRLSLQMKRLLLLLHGYLVLNSTKRTQTSISLHELDPRTGKIVDSIMFDRISEDGQKFVAKTKEHIQNYAKAGLRTLVVAYRVIGEEEYKTWQLEFLKANNSLSADRDALVDAAAIKIERDLMLLGATTVEDKLQKGVPECIDKLVQAGIKIWVLTGDKLETAVNIGLLREEMKQIVITLDTPEISALEKQRDKEALVKESGELVSGACT
ncbi:hypothetical protein MKX01_036033 [Papaver californicum]|nr:hypothetical protein MKX01_036033 [Papaver californicum]